MITTFLNFWERLPVLPPKFARQKYLHHEMESGDANREQNFQS